ncbi:MAG: acyltransferase [Bacteroidales bacterium]|nr:acyltransferase [Bacteroidales bacterium]
MATYIPLASKPRYEILDGLRGVAAMIVVAFHLFETYSAGPRFQILNHGYLAVDFFFVLSGFVIGYAYDDRWGRMSLGGFFKRRLVRLHPMLIMGTLIGALLFFFGDAPGFELVGQTSIGTLMLVTLLGCCMIPLVPWWDIRGWQEVNPLNGAAWSLMWEYVANILYALVIRRFPTLLLGVFVGFSALLTIDVAMDIDTFMLLSPRSYAQYTVIGGFGLSPDQIYIGIARLLYPFFMGLLISRIPSLRLRVRGGFWWCSLLLAIMLCCPYAGTEAHPWLDGLYNVGVILVMCPLLVVMGSGSFLTDNRSMAICKWLGAISYPLYITHYPWVYLQIKWAADHKDAPLGHHIFVAVSIFIIVVAIAWATLKLYDLPLRQWLTDHWLRRTKAPAKQPQPVEAPQAN